VVSYIIFQRDHDGKVTSEEVAAAATYLKHNLDNAGIEELIGSLSKDKGNNLTVAGAPRRAYNHIDKYWFYLCVVYRWEDPC
jgi:hypothetical protein